MSDSECRMAFFFAFPRYGLFKMMGTDVFISV